MTFGWLRSPGFDLGLIFGTTALGLLAGLCVALQPTWLPWVLVLDFWLLGYHHVVATFTRLVFDKASLAEHRWLVTWLPPLVAIATCALALGVGTWALIATYFYWQAWHYTRQGWGMSRIYRRKEPAALLDDRLDAAMLFAVPVAGVVSRSAQGWTRFLGLDIALLPVPTSAVPVALGLAGVVTIAWIARQVTLAARGQVGGAHALYVLTHTLVFAVGYLVVPDFTHGWLVVNVWHNAQYLFIVWMFNLNRFRGGETADAPLLSAISQPNAVGRYVFVNLAIATIVFTAILALPGLKVMAVPAVLLFSQALNFHHYIVDSLVWKVRRPQVRANLVGG